jgi:hypothetical protein
MRTLCNDEKYCITNVQTKEIAINTNPLQTLVQNDAPMT